MKLPTFVVLSVLFCLSHGQEPTEYTDVTSSMSLFQARYTYPPKIMTIKNQIYTVFLKMRVSVSGASVQFLITSVDGGNRSEIVKTCDLSVVPPDLFSEVEIDKVVVLGNGKLVIATSRQRHHEKTWLYNIIIDPFDCSSERTVTFPYTYDGGSTLALIPYYDSYDIFYTYYTDDKIDLPENTFPYRYNDQGQRIELDYSLKNILFYYRFQINTIKPFDASEGYYHSYFNSYSDEYVLQRLDSRFQKVKEIRLYKKDSTYGLSIGVSTTQGHINYCLLEIENLSCNILNADLEVQVTSKLPELNFPSAGYIDEHKVINLPNNKGLVVFIAYKHLPDDSGIFSKSRISKYLYDFYLQWVSSNGSKIETRKIGSASLENKNDYKIVDTDRKDFCHVTISTHFGNGEDDVNLYNRCLNL